MPPPPKLRLLLRLVLAATAAAAVFLALGDEEARTPAPESPSAASSVFTGHYGYILRLPPKYAASAGFADPSKTRELVYIHPEGLDPTNFAHEGLYEHLGILRLEASPRRVAGGEIGPADLKALALRRLTQEKAAHTLRSLDVNGLPGALASAKEPFRWVQVHFLGEKVLYTLTAGAENELLSGVLSSFAETSPHDRPGLLPLRE